MGARCLADPLSSDITARNYANFHSCPDFVIDYYQSAFSMMSIQSLPRPLVGGV